MYVRPGYPCPCCATDRSSMDVMGICSMYLFLYHVREAAVLLYVRFMYVHKNMQCKDG